MVEKTEESNPIHQAVKGAMKEAAKDVRAPKCVRDGTVKTIDEQKEIAEREELQAIHKDIQKYVGHVDTHTKNDITKMIQNGYRRIR